ncbi:putative lipid metabolism-related protein [Rhodotorula sp. JG-1b]|nr:putative lipid metabolism-related protein [Rhodotorula sp. JG-1b]
MSWLVRRVLYALRLAAPVRLVHHAEPVSLVYVDEDGEKHRSSLAKVLENCPSLTGPDNWYCPTPWLASGHLATIACTIFSFRYDPIEYTRELIRVPDGGTIAVDITPPVAPNEKLDNTPLLVVSHGLTGGSHESYVRNVLAIVTRPVAQGGLGWRAAVVNSRGCAGAPITSPKLYSGEVTDDLRCALAFLSHFAPDAPLYGIGFSLGANQQAKFVGEEGPDCPYNGAVVLGAPFDFVKGHIALSSSWLRGIYSRAMAANLKRLLWRHQDQLKQHPKLDWDSLFDNPNTTLFEFDSLVTAPLGNHETAIKYYRSASATRFLDQVAVPLLSFSAMDDPVVCSQGVPSHAAKANPNLVFAFTQHGGHLGWFEGLFRPRRWIAKPVVEFLKALHEANPTPRRHAAVQKTVPPREADRRPEIGDEMVTLEGRPEIGFKRVGAEQHDARGGEAVEGTAELTQGL